MEIHINPKHNCHCLKCGFSWFSSMLYTQGRPPKACASCHRYDWMYPRIRQRSKKITH